MATVVSGSNSGNNYVDALVYSGAHWSDTITYSFSNTYQMWTAAEMGSFTDALQAWANVANISIQQSASAAGATFVEYSLTNEQTNSLFGTTGGATLGVHELPVVGAGQSYHGWFNRDAYTYADGTAVGYHPAGLRVGAEGYATFLHEIGHGLGLTHPFDTVHGAGAYVLPAALDEGVYTVMSYVDGWSGQDPFSHNVAIRGYSNTPGAIDIAAIQWLYGANLSTNAGANVYDLTTQTGWTSIWDTGGIDEIRYTGSANATIDLRPADLTAGSSIAGGALSHVAGGFGGFTIAADFTNVLADVGTVTGVIIENATGGSGNDTITGNNVANVLTGNGGDDTIAGLGGNDYLHGGAGIDQIFGDDGNDTIVFDAADDLANVQGGEGYDWLVLMNGSSEPNSFSLTAHGFEAGYYLDSASRLDKIQYAYSDRSSLTVDYDQAGVNSWDQTWTAKDTQGHTDYVYITYDTSDSRSLTYSDYDGLGRLDFDYTSYTNGSWTYVDFDQAGSSNWSTIAYVADTLGRLDTADIRYDDNSRLFVDYDQANEFNWSYHYIGYTLTGQVSYDFFV